MKNKRQVSSFQFSVPGPTANRKPQTENSKLKTVNRERGFTLVEIIIVIVITGIIGAMVAVFLRSPILQYMDVARRAEMTDTADTALRRIGRDLRLALPNSVRVTGSCDGVSPCFIEFLPTKGGGRYRAGTGGTGNELDFAATGDDSFEVLGPMPAMVAGAMPDQIVVYNLGITRPAICPAPLPATCGSDAYQGDNRAAYISNTANTITIVNRQFPFDSPGHRFHVINTPVSYVCAPAVGGEGGTLTRWQGYAIQSGQPVTLPSTGTPSSALLATQVSSCRFTYDPYVVAQRSGLVTLQLGISKGEETVTLYSAAHVSNQP
ncbi:MAG: prepilin-type N-terminal cleavage/methylation domain-containing protein [Gallionella sp.]|jgi:MSHA biogenesis protein MshO